MEVIDKWVAEFFIRRLKNPRVSPTNLLPALKSGYSSSSNNCSKLKKASVLREISDSLIRGNIDEGTLDLLETLKKLQGEEGDSSGLMESAYCWTAAECTVRFMSPLSVSEGLYCEALERIWTRRVGVVKESGKSGELLLRWEADLRKAVEDPEVYQRIRESNVRFNAVCFLNRLLEEQWEMLGSSSLESVAQRLLKGREEDPNAENGEDNRDEQHGGEETMGAAQEQSLDIGDEMAAPELMEYLLEIQRRIDSSSTTRQVLQEPNNANVTPRVIRRSGGTSGGGQESSSEIGLTRDRPSLPTPVPLNVSPLRKKTKADPKTRRPKKFWRPEEVDALREGVKEHGKSWKDIKNANPAVFAERTEVDLKDKWRNLVR